MTIYYINLFINIHFYSSAVNRTVCADAPNNAIPDGSGKQDYCLQGDSPIPHWSAWPTPMSETGDATTRTPAASAKMPDANPSNCDGVPSTSSSSTSTRSTSPGETTTSGQTTAPQTTKKSGSSTQMMTATSLVAVLSFVVAIQSIIS